MERYTVEDGSLRLNGAVLPIPRRIVARVLGRRGEPPEGPISPAVAEEIVEEARIEANTQLRRYLRAALS